MKNVIGVTVLSNKMFQLKEWWETHKPNWNNIKNKIGFSLSNFIKIYNKYRFIFLFFIWILASLIFPSYYIFNTCAIIIIAGLSILAKYINFIIKKFYITTDFSNAQESLDKLIADCIQEYTTMNTMDNITYINDVLENKIREEVINMVVTKMSRQLYTKLTLLYNEDVIHEIIATRVYIIVMRLVVEINKDKDSETMNNPPINNQSFDLGRYMMMPEE
ncbi:MAG: hypothetical protein IJ193_00055 [Bacilli bacterium]|nr:hypothetical protein [Bacilli bacterium]